MTEVMDPREAELQELQHEYRHMEMNRRAFAEESQSVLRKQQSTIDKLRKDNENLKNEISMLMRTSAKPLSVVQQERLQKLHDQGDHYANSIEFERRNIQTMEEQIQIMKNKVLQQRRDMGGVNASKENNYMIQKQIRILENRLEKALVKFNEAIAHNKTLRDEIDDLRSERKVYENIYRKMERELQERKQKMAEIIETSNQSYEQRDNYQMEVAAIEQANRKEQEEFEEQMIKMEEILATELRLPAFGSNTNASLGRSTPTAKLPGNSRGPLGITYGDDTKDDRRSKSNSSGALKSHSSMQASLSASAIERVQNFEEAFGKIRSATGITDIEELVRTFIKNEDHNFSLFNYVNEQNNEIEKVQEQIEGLMQDESKYKQESGDDKNQQKQILKDLESKTAATEVMAEKYEVRSQDLQRTLESLKRGILSIRDKIEEEDEGGNIADMLVTESNLVQYLGLIEQKANALLLDYADMKTMLLNGGPTSYSPPKDGASANLPVVLGTGPKYPMGHDNLHVNPPKLDDYLSDEEEEDEEDVRPLTMEELKMRTLNRLHRGRGQGQAAKGTNKKSKGLKLRS
jgi:hypothetical protein